MSAVLRWFCPPVPLARIAVLRVLVYLFVPVDVLLTTSWVGQHANVPGELYRPLWVGRALPLPTPETGFVHAWQVLLLVAAVLAALPWVGGRWPRLLGGAVFVLYAEWMVIAMSYGKVDHDRFAYLVALAVLPTVGRARAGDRQESEAAGWAVRVVQLAVIATYFLAAWAKIRFGGWEWVNSATMTTAVLRRGTVFSDWTLDYPWLLQATQWMIVAFELLSPLVLFLKPRWQWAAVGFFVVFHAVTFLGVRIIFLPHLVALTVFLPLERLGRWAAAEPATEREPVPVSP